MGYFLPSFVENDPVVLKNFLLSLFRNYPPLEKGEAHHLKKVESPLSKDDLCQVSLNCPGGFEEEDF